MSSGTDNIEEFLTEPLTEEELLRKLQAGSKPMTQIKVELVGSCCTDLDTVNAARVSFDKESEWIDNPFKNNKSDCLHADDVKLIKYLAAHKHMTPFRHNFIKLRVKAPIFLAAQLKKHQAGLSWNEVSRRYVSSEPEFYVPDAWRAKPEGSIKQGSAGVVTDLVYDNVYSEDIVPVGPEYAEFIDNAVDFYNTMLKSDVAPEMARMVLPQSMMTEWIWSGNLLAFAHVYKERIANGAQQEAQDFAKQLNEAIGDLAPVSWKALTNEH